MFKHILIPTDGTALSERAIQTGVRLAQALGAHVTGFHAMPEFHVLTYRTGMLEHTREEYARDCRDTAERYLEAVRQAAKAHRVDCTTRTVTHDHFDEAIVEAVRHLGADLIVMASHGRGGMQGVLLGSTTQKVLTHAMVPVLVCR